MHGSFADGTDTAAYQMTRALLRGDSTCAAVLPRQEKSLWRLALQFISKRPGPRFELWDWLCLLRRHPCSRAVTVGDSVVVVCRQLCWAEATGMAETVGQNWCWRAGLETVGRLQPRLEGPRGAIEQCRIKCRTLHRAWQLHTHARRSELSLAIQMRGGGGTAHGGCNEVCGPLDAPCPHHGSRAATTSTAEAGCSHLHGSMHGGRDWNVLRLLSMLWGLAVWHAGRCCAHACLRRELPGDHFNLVPLLMLQAVSVPASVRLAVVMCPSHMSGCATKHILLVLHKTREQAPEGGCQLGRPARHVNSG